MPRYVALDLGTHAVKATVWSVTRQETALLGRFAEAVPQDGSGIPSLAARLAALDALLDREPLLAASGSLVGLAWGGAEAAMHELTMPFTDPKQIDKTLPFAVEAEVPFDLDEMVMGWRPLEVTETGTRALVALAKEARLRETIDALAERGLDPTTVAVDEELLVGWEWSGDTTTALIDVGHTRTLIAVVKNGELVAARDIDVGGSTVTLALADALGCAWEQAEALKEGRPIPVEVDVGDLGGVDLDGPASEEDTDPGLDETSVTPPVPERRYRPVGELPTSLAELPDEAVEAVRAAVEELMAQVRASLIAVEDAHQIDTDRILLGGGGSLLHGLQEAMATDLGLPVLRLADQEGELVPPINLVSDALALRMTGQSGGPIVDLRTGDLAYRSGSDVLSRALTWGGGMLVGLSLVAVVAFFVQSTSLSSQIGEVEAEIDGILAKALPGEKVKGPESAMRKMRARIDEAEARAAALGDGATPPTVDLLSVLTEAFPPHPEVVVQLTSLQMTREAIKFEAETDGYASSAAVEERLQQHPRFSRAEKQSDTKVRDKVRFSVSIPLGDAEEEG